MLKITKITRMYECKQGHKTTIEVEDMLSIGFDEMQRVYLQDGDRLKSYTLCPVCLASVVDDISAKLVSEVWT